MKIRAMLNPSDRFVIDGFDRGGPGAELLVVRILLFEVMDVA